MPFRTQLPPVSDEMLAAIGRFIVDWNELEQAMEAAIWSALHLDFFSPEAKIVTGGLGFRQKREMVERFFDCLLSSAEPAACPPRAEVEELEKARNIIAHGRWRGGHLHESVTVYARASQQDQSHPVQAAELLELAARVRNVTEKYRALDAAFRFLPA